MTSGQSATVQKHGTAAVTGAIVYKKGRLYDSFPDDFLQKKKVRNSYEYSW